MTRTTTTLLSLLLLSGTISMAQSDRTPEEVTFIKDIKKLPNAEWQAELRSTNAWTSFLDRNGTWYVEFNEESRRPHKAFGKPIPTTGSTDRERALNFLGQELGAYGLHQADLQLISTPKSSKHTYVHFKQFEQGLEVLGSRFTAKLDQEGNVISFTTDLYDMGDLDITPMVSVANATAAASDGLSGIVNTVDAGLAVLPVPVQGRMQVRLVRQIEVHTQQEELPGHYVSYVDANSGELLYRSNTVKHHDHAKCGGHDNTPPASADISLTGTIFEEHPFVPATVQPLAFVNGTLGGQPFQTDQNGQFISNVTGPVGVTMELAGSWSTVLTGGVTPNMSFTAQDGPNSVSFDNDANERELSAYYHVNIVHEHMKAVLPSFTGMDFSLPTNVDVGGNCNAFYDGSSINFYAEGNDCQSYAKLGEVVYHEYGHGINDKFYQSQGSFFNNGAMNEGYADIWSLTITLDGVLAEGSSLSDPNDYIRRYDQNPKVYPADISGSVHGDGEIIAGAWWDTYLLLGNDLPLTLQLFADHFPGLQATTFNGNEGIAFRDVLIDVLQADDNDGDITNGTPNGNIIVQAFAIHGITLISNATLDHTALESAPENQDINITADLSLQFPFTNYLNTVSLFYKVNNTSTYTTVPMTNTGGQNYQTDIPGQPVGSLIAYYLGVTDIFNQVTAVTPIGAAKPSDPNLPNFILVDMAVQLTEDFDSNNELGNWTITLPTDDASTGEWIWSLPIPSFIDVSDPSTMVQPGEQHTPLGEFCLLTGNANSPTAGLGEEDVDDGTTTFMTDIIDLTAYTNPVFTYYRWWSNNTGALPNEDPLEVAISDDGGSTWQFLEYTRTSDRSWRRNAFRVQDHITVNDQFRMKVNASDSAIYGGSLVEAAFDDFQLWDNASPQGVEEHPVVVNSVFPDPANDQLNFRLTTLGSPQATTEVMDMTGRVVLTRPLGVMNNSELITLPIANLAEGQYVLQVRWEGGQSRMPFLIIR